MTTNYARGANFERKVIKYLESLGYRCIRSAGSHKAVDVVAICPVGSILLIQCKLGGVISPGEWGDLWDWGYPEGGIYPVLASKAGRGSIEFVRLTGPKRDQFELLDVYSL